MSHFDRQPVDPLPKAVWWHLLVFLLAVGLFVADAYGVLR